MTANRYTLTRTQLDGVERTVRTFTDPDAALAARDELRLAVPRHSNYVRVLDGDAEPPNQELEHDDERNA